MTMPIIICVGLSGSNKHMTPNRRRDVRGSHRGLWVWVGYRRGVFEPADHRRPTSITTVCGITTADVVGLALVAVAGSRGRHGCAREHWPMNEIFGREIREPAGTILKKIRLVFATMAMAHH